MEKTKEDFSENVEEKSVEQLREINERIKENRIKKDRRETKTNFFLGLSLVVVVIVGLLTMIEQLYRFAKFILTAV